MTDHKDASESGYQCGLSDGQRLERFEEQKQEVEPRLSDGQPLEPLEQPEQLEQGKIPKIEFSRLSTPFLGSPLDPEHGEFDDAKGDANTLEKGRTCSSINASLCESNCTPGEFDDAKGDTITPEKGRTGSSIAASLCEGNTTPRSVSPRVVAALGTTFTEDSTCSVCGLELGKRKLRPRHHCRICWGSVCASCSPSSVRLEGEEVLQRACNPCVQNIQGGPVLRERLDDLSDQLSIIGGSRSPPDGKADTLEDAIRRCESTLPGLDRESDNHRSTKEELQEVKAMYAAAETHATEADIQVKRLSEELRVLKAELQEAQQLACKKSQSRQVTSGIDGLLF